MTTLRSKVAAGAIAVAAVATSIGVDVATASSGQDDLAAVRAATARYHDLDAAIGDGYTNFDLCFDSMGEHFGRPSAIGDGTLDATAPEALVYAHIGNRLQLVAVEYVSTEPGEVLGTPLHFNPTVGLWVLHAWVWKHNPDGVHADFNPNVGDCP